MTALPLPTKAGGYGSLLSQGRRSEGALLPPRGADSARAMPHSSRAKHRGRRECRAPVAPVASRAKTKEHTSIVTTVTPVAPGIPRADGFNGFLRALLGDRACLPPSSAELSPANLTPASGRQDHTTSPSASKRRSSSAQKRPPHPAPNVRDDRETPLERARDGGEYGFDLGQSRSEIFLA